MTATHPSIQLCTSHVSLMNSGFSNFSAITFLNFGCALLMDGFAVEYVWMLCRMSSEFFRSSSPGVIAVTCGVNLHPCWSTVAFTAFGAPPLALGTDTMALARPLLPPTTTFSMTASVPHFSVSLFTLSFSTTGAPAYVTVASIVPPPCAPAGPGRLATRATPVTSAIARSVPITLRMAVDPPEFGSCPSVRNSHHEQHHRQCKDGYDRRNDETAARLRLLQPQIVPRRQRHLGAALPRSAVPRLERDRHEHRGREGRARLALGHERTPHDQTILTVGVDRLASRLRTLDRRNFGWAVRRRLRHALAVLPAQQIDGVRRIAHQEVWPLRARRGLRRELQRDPVGVELLPAVLRRLGRIVPRQVERDLLVVVDRPDRDQVDRRIEIARILDDLPHQRNVVGRQLLPEVGVGVVGNGVRHRGHRDERRVAGRLGAERQDEVRQVPDVLGLLDAVDERGHRRAEDAGGQPRGDLGPRGPAAERPALGQVRGRDRLAPLVLQLGTRRPVGPALGAVTLVALDRLEHLLAALDRLRGRADFLGQLDLLGRFLELVSRERLDVGDEVPAVSVGEHGPRRHRRAGHAIGDDAEEVLVRRDLVRGRPDLVDPCREVARLRHQELGGRPLAVALLAVTADALELVHGLAGVRVTGLRADEDRRAEDERDGGEDRKS